MNNIELKALRKNLGLTAYEAARHLAADAERPRGVSAATWEKWEAGLLDIPARIPEALADWVARKYKAVEDYAAQIEDWQDFGGAPVVALWYPDIEDTSGLMDWRVSQSIAGEVAAMGGRVVEFDAFAYNDWMTANGYTADNLQMRASWAQEELQNE